MNLHKGQLIIIGVVLFVVLVVVLGIFGVFPLFKKSGPTDPNFPTTPVTLEMWGVGDSSAAFSSAIKAYTTSAKNVKINYTQFSSLDQYEKALVDALAAKKGPDIFMIHNTWVSKHLNKMMPAYSSLLTSASVSSLYPAVVSSDFVRDGYVYALPLNLDALALLYNKDIFNARAIVYPPTTWDEVLSLVRTLRVTDTQGKVTTAAIALGGAYNIEPIRDILSVLGLQLGTSFSSPDGSVRLNDTKFSQAVSFYLQFSDPLKDSYTWNESFSPSREALANGQVAMTLDYFSALDAITKKNPFAPIEAVPLPQLSGAVAGSIANFVSYMGLAVSKQSAYPYVAWHFASYLTMSDAVSDTYLQQTGKLPALKTLINKGIQAGDRKSVFLKSFLTAKTWRQADATAIASIFRSMIFNIISGKLDQSKAIGAAQEQINQLGAY